MGKGDRVGCGSVGDKRKYFAAMRFSRFRLRFSIRTLLAAFAIFGAILALSVRFGPHLLWKTIHRDISSGVVAIPSTPLIDEPLIEPVAKWEIGPISLELPESMSLSADVQHKIGGTFLTFQDDSRRVFLQIPQRDNGFLQEETSDFPDKSKLTFSRLHKEICDARSADFSFAMSHQELRWHQWLLKYRSLMSNDSFEYLWGSELEGILQPIGRSGSAWVFQWGLTDRKWEGTINFRDSSPGKKDWIRHACATFTIDGDCAVLQNLNDDALKGMVKITKLDGTDEREPAPSGH